MSKNIEWITKMSVINTTNSPMNIPVFSKDECFNALSIAQIGNEHTAVNGAEIMCSNAAYFSKPIRVVKVEGNIEISDKVELNKKDITFEGNFKGCKRTLDRICGVKKEDIEDGEWKGVDRTRSHEENVETINVESSYCVCKKGNGVIYFMDSGQEIKKFLKTLAYDIGTLGIDVREFLRIKELSSQWDIEYNPVRWTMWDILMWQTNVDKQAFIHNEKLEFIRQYKDVIKDAANEYDIPILLMAGVVYKEYGGDPMFVDHGIYMIRGWELESLGGPIFDFMDDKLGIYRGEEYTSFGNVSIQLRRVCESLGLNYGELRRDVVDEIVLSCKDPVENIYIAAKHLSDLRDMQYPGLSGDDMQDEEIIIIGTRYNRGPDLTLEEINENTSYGTEMLINKEEIEKALEE